MVLELFLINTQARKALEHSPRTIMPSSSLWEIVASSLTLARSILLRYRAFLSKQIQTSRTFTQFRETASSLMRALYLTTASTPTPPASLRQACPWPWRSRTAPHGFFPLIQGEKERFVILGEQWTLQERWNVERPHTACRIAKGLSTLHRGAQLLSGRKIKNHLSYSVALYFQIL